jgi:hypothetical protein
MLNWIQILKLDQVTIGSTVLDNRPLPEEEERDCCEEAKAKYKKNWVRKLDNLPTLSDILDCDEFKEFLSYFVNRSDLDADILLNIIDEWEECENA